MDKTYLPFLGLSAGFASASLGIGGGVIMVPALVLLFGYGIKRAVGTSLATIAPCAAVGVMTHYLVQPANIQFYFVAIMLLGSLVGAKYGAKLANKISGRVLTLLFASLLLFVGLRLAGVINIPVSSVSGDGLYLLLVVLGFIAGSGSALFGIGGGAIMVPALNLVFGLSIHQAIATSLIVIVPTTIAGSIFHKKFDNINTAALKSLVPMSLVGAVFGAIFANNMPSSDLKIIFGVFMIFASLRLFFQKKLGSILFDFPNCQPQIEVLSMIMA